MTTGQWFQGPTREVDIIGVVTLAVVAVLGVGMLLALWRTIRK